MGMFVADKGETEVKGKGKMQTYALIREPRERLPIDVFAYSPSAPAEESISFRKQNRWTWGEEEVAQPAQVGISAPVIAI